MLVGAENGNVRVFPLRESVTTPGQYDIGNFHSLWTLSIHDNQYGHVTHICCSHDDKYILTAGRDGNVFVFQASLEAELRKEEAEHLGDIKVKDVRDYCVMCALSEFDWCSVCVWVWGGVHTYMCVFHSLL